MLRVLKVPPFRTVSPEFFYRLLTTSLRTDYSSCRFQLQDITILNLDYSLLSHRAIVSGFAPNWLWNNLDAVSDITHGLRSLGLLERTSFTSARLNFPDFDILANDLS